jgi:hypothetical protein
LRDSFGYPQKIEKSEKWCLVATPTARYNPLLLMGQQYICKYIAYYLIRFLEAFCRQVSLKIMLKMIDVWRPPCVEAVIARFRLAYRIRYIVDNTSIFGGYATIVPMHQDLPSARTTPNHSARLANRSLVSPVRVALAMTTIRQG